MNKTDKTNKKETLAFGCTCMTLTSETGKHYWFRTCDLEPDLRKEGTHRVVHKKNSVIKYMDGKEEKCLYDITGITYNDKDTWLLDGINEKGLCGGLLMLPEGTSVEKEEKGRQGLMGMEAVTKFLSQCDSVREVVLMADKLQITHISYMGEQLTATVHYFFTDCLGEEVVLEATDTGQPGILQIYETEAVLGVMTNSPPYPAQKENLSWFLANSAQLRQGIKGQPITSLELDGRRIEAHNGAAHLSLSGLLPGSYASYDRFIRIAVLKALNKSGNGFPDEKMLALGTGIMNVVREPDNQGVFHYEYISEEGEVRGNHGSRTQYLVMYDLSEKCFYLQFYDQVQWQCYGLEKS